MLSSCDAAFNLYCKADKRSYTASPIVSYWRGDLYPTCPVGHQLAQFDPDRYAAALEIDLALYPDSKKLPDAVRERNKQMRIEYRQGTLYPLQAWEDEPRIETLGGTPKLHPLKSRFAISRHRYIQDVGVSSRFVYDRAETVLKSWQAFLKGNAKPPKFKNRRHPVTSLISTNSQSVRIDGDRIQIPNLKMVKAKGLSKRWAIGTKVSVLKIIKAADGWYLQLTGDVNEAQPVKVTGKVAGIDPGAVRHHTLDNGAFQAPPSYMLKSAKKLLQLQRKSARQWRTNATPIYTPSGRLLRWSVPKDWQRKNFDKTKAKIAKLHQKVSRQRRAFNHRLSSKYIALYDAIALEDTQLQNMTRAVKKGEPGVANGRKAKSGLNKSMLDNAIGQFYTMLETKAKASGRAVIRVAPAYTSQTCNQCGYRSSENRLSQSKFCCQHCGHKANADTNAAKNIKTMMMLGIEKLTFTDNFADGWREPVDVEQLDPPKPAAKPKKAKSKPKGSRTKRDKGSAAPKGRGRKAAVKDRGGSRKSTLEPSLQLDVFEVH